MLQHTNPLAAEPRLSRRSLDQGQSGADAEVPSRAHSHHSHGERCGKGRGLGA